MSEFDRTAYMTTGQAARYLAVSAETVRRWVDDGKLEAVVTPTRRRLVLRSSVAALQPRPAARDAD